MKKKRCSHEFHSEQKFNRRKRKNFQPIVHFDEQNELEIINIICFSMIVFFHQVFKNYDSFIFFYWSYHFYGHILCKSEDWHNDIIYPDEWFGFFHYLVLSHSIIFFCLLLPLYHWYDGRCVYFSWAITVLLLSILYSNQPFINP